MNHRFACDTMPTSEAKFDQSPMSKVDENIVELEPSLGKGYTSSPNESKFAYLGNEYMDIEVEDAMEFNDSNKENKNPWAKFSYNEDIYDNKTSKKNKILLPRSGRVHNVNLMERSELKELF